MVGDFPTGLLLWVIQRHEGSSMELCNIIFLLRCKHGGLLVENLVGFDHVECVCVFLLMDCLKCCFRTSGLSWIYLMFFLMHIKFVSFTPILVASKLARLQTLAMAASGAKGICRGRKPLHVWAINNIENRLFWMFCCYQH